MVIGLSMKLPPMAYDVQSIKQPGWKILFVLRAQRWAQNYPCYASARDRGYVNWEVGASSICVIAEESYSLVSNIANCGARDEH